MMDQDEPPKRKRRGGKPQPLCQRCRTLGRYHIARHWVQLGQTVTHVCKVCVVRLTECGGRRVASP
jgi:hypothetical protein